jgi:stage II sporulation protein P
MRRKAGRGLGICAAAALAAAMLLATVLAVCVPEAALALGGFAAGPVPAARTALALAAQRLAEAQSDADAEPEPETLPEDEAGTTGDANAAAAQFEAAQSIEAYEVELLGEDARPADAGTVLEKTYPQGSGDNYIACGAGSIKNNTSVDAADIAAEIENPLPFAIELNSTEPQVLVMHTHATETYRLAAGLWFTPGDSSRSTDRSINMCAVGAVVADTLNAAGINTLHDETLNDYPSYTGSYANSRAVVQAYLAQYPSIKMVLDVHRDAIESESGARYAPVCTIDGKQAAQVMIICGSDNGTTAALPNWRQNLRFAAAWERAMESAYPGLTRPVMLSYRFYNQDLTTGSLLIEIGGHGNNLNEALYAGQLAAEALAAALTQTAA